MLDGGGSLFDGGNSHWKGPGGEFVFNNHIMARHAYDATDNGTPKLLISDLYWTQNGWPTYQEQNRPAVVSGTTYKLMNAGGGKLLDAYGARVARGTNVDIYKDTHGMNQTWTVYRNSDGTYRLINANSNTALDTAGLGTSDGTNVDIWPYHDAINQKWSITANGDGTLTLLDANSHKALDTGGFGSTDGANVQIFTKNGSAAQAWSFIQY